MKAVDQTKLMSSSHWLLQTMFSCRDYVGSYCVPVETIGSAPRCRSLSGSSRMVRVRLLSLHEALSQLERQNPRRAEVVHLKFFGGLTIEEIADTLGISSATVQGDWRFARAYLRSQLDGAWNERKTFGRSFRAP